MKTIILKTVDGKEIFKHECENNTIKKTLLKAIELKINLSGAHLRGANLRGTDLRGVDLRDADLRLADLRGADLGGANLRLANLRDADLRDADLGGANLSNAKTSKRYISISNIGSSKRMTTYCYEDDIIWCGCFKGNLQEFEKQVIKTHKNNEQYLKEYLGAINYLKSLKN